MLTRIVTTREVGNISFPCVGNLQLSNRSPPCRGTACFNVNFRNGQFHLNVLGGTNKRLTLTPVFLRKLRLFTFKFEFFSATLKKKTCWQTFVCLVIDMQVSFPPRIKPNATIPHQTTHSPCSKHVAFSDELHIIAIRKPFSARLSEEGGGGIKSRQFT